MSSTKNPIVILKNGKKARVHEMKLEMGVEFQNIEVYLDSGDLLAKQNVSEMPYLSLDSELGVVKIVYKDMEDNYIDSETVDLNISDDDDKYYSEDELKYLKIKKYIEEDMDNPRGSEKEQTEHTQLLRDTSIYNHAKEYVISRIRRLLLDQELVSPGEINDLSLKLYADIYCLGPIQELDEDPEVGEIMVNARVFPHFQSDIYYIKNGKKEKHYYEFNNLEQLKNVFDRVIMFNKKALNSVESAIVEAVRPNRDRVNIIIPDASENYVLNIRKFTNFVPNLETMKRSGTVDNFIDRLMDVLVRGKANIGIGGAMATGKTTYINYALTYTDPIERKVVIASVSETDVDRVLSGHDVIVLNVDDSKGFTFDNLVRTSLRTTADRVIIPESRGGEFKQLYEANLKTRGNMFTAHALDDESFLDMCVDMYMSSESVGREQSKDVKDKITKAVDVVIIMRKVGDKIRIKSVSEVIANSKGEYEKMNPLYEWSFDPERPLEGEYVRTENRISDRLKKQLNEFGVPMSEMEGL